MRLVDSGTIVKVEVPQFEVFPGDIHFLVVPEDRFQDLVVAVEDAVDVLEEAFVFRDFLLVKFSSTGVGAEFLIGTTDDGFPTEGTRIFHNACVLSALPVR